MSSAPAPAAAPGAPTRHRSAVVAVAWILVVVLGITTIVVTVLGGVLVYQGQPKASKLKIDRSRTLTVLMVKDASQQQIDGAEQVIKASPAVASYTFLSKRDAYEDFKQKFKDEPDVVKSITPDMVSVNFVVKVKIAAQRDPLATKLEALNGVDTVITSKPDNGVLTQKERDKAAQEARDKAALVASVAEPSVEYETLGWTLLAAAGGFLLVGVAVAVIVVATRSSGRAA